jgi:ribosomal protein S18 acetylase RimI-like enzyme
MKEQEAAAIAVSEECRGQGQGDKLLDMTQYFFSGADFVCGFWRP